MLGWLIRGGYPYVGEWYEEPGAETGTGEPPLTFAEARAGAASTAFSAAGVYACLLAASLVGVALNRVRGRM